MDQDASGRRARLTLVVEHALHRDTHGGVQVGIGQDQQRVLAAQFHRRVGQVFGRAAQHALAGHRRPGERDALHLRVRGRAGPAATPGTAFSTPGGSTSLASSVSRSTSAAPAPRA